MLKHLYIYMGVLAHISGRNVDDILKENASNIHDSKNKNMRSLHRTSTKQTTKQKQRNSAVRTKLHLPGA